MNYLVRYIDDSAIYNKDVCPSSSIPQSDTDAWYSASICTRTDISACHTALDIYPDMSPFPVGLSNFRFCIFIYTRT